MNITKISSIGTTFRPNNIKKTLPILTTPLLAYYIGESQDNNANEILNFFKRKNLKIPDYLKPHADTQSGFNSQSKTKLKKALDEAYKKNIITEKEHDKYVNKLTFTGSAENDIYQGQNIEQGADIVQDKISEKISNPELQAKLDYFNKLNTDLPPDLQEIYDAPPIKTPEGIISSILGDDFLENNNIDLHWDFLSTLKKMAADILDFGD